MINCSGLLCREPGNIPNLHFRGAGVKTPVIVWNITDKCNLSCAHCYANIGSRDAAKSLSPDDAINFIENVSSLNPPALIFSGGEPLLREDIFELGGYAAEKGIYAALSTNGILITREVAKKIKKSGFRYVGISLDGMETAHDKFRGSTGAFQLSLSGIDNCLYEGIKTGVRFTISRYNYNDLCALATFLAGRGINRFCLYHLVYSEKSRALIRDDIDNEIRRSVLDSFFYTIEEIISRQMKIEVLTVDNHADGIFLYHKIKKNKPESGPAVERLITSGNGCSAGIGIANVDPDGEVYPCQFWHPFSLGNVKEKCFSEIWNNKNNELLNMLRNGRNNLAGKCGRCKYKYSCGGCRARAEKTFSDIWAEDPSCYLTEEEIS